MRALAVMGGRNRLGQTARAAGAFLQGYASEQGESETVYLPELKLERCRQCEDSGWGVCLSEGRCVIGDDFAGLVQRIKEADLVVFANPVYFGDLSESMRAFLDRLRRVCMNEQEKAAVNGKPAVGICVAGGGGGGAPNCAVSLEKVLQCCGFDVKDLWPLRRQNLEQKLSTLVGAGAAAGNRRYFENKSG